MSLQQSVSRQKNPGLIDYSSFVLSNLVSFLKILSFLLCSLERKEEALHPGFKV